ncbi:uncharacterized protein LOC135931483 isoform X2 [Gordionus sp. m RMFG-2023]|uniref:uncharacterized protein LOC135931483 isoform X2 n=1 Tax=Gordionus sp. m RMFG-2023 TaxID=3053472 RepID=UPI0031FCE39D
MIKIESLKKSDLANFACDIHSHDALINDIFYVLNDPRHQEYDPVYHQLYDFYRSEEHKLRLFCVQFIPTLVYTYLKEHSRLKGFDAEIYSKLESFLVSIHNLSLANGILQCDTSDMQGCEIFYPLNHPSIYHNPQFISSAILSEHYGIFSDLSLDRSRFLINNMSISHFNQAISSDCNYGQRSVDFLYFDQIPDTELVFTINAQNRFQILTVLIYLYNLFLAEYPLRSLKLACMVVVNTCLSSFNEHLHRASIRNSLYEDTPENRILANENLYVQFLRTIYFCLYNGVSEQALEALEALNTRSTYHLYSRILMMVGCIKNSILPSPAMMSQLSRSLKYRPLDLTSSPLALYLSSVPMTHAPKSAITNASFKLKKLPEDISPVMPPFTQGLHKNLETLKEEDQRMAEGETKPITIFAEKKLVSKSQSTANRLKDVFLPHPHQPHLAPDHVSTYETSQHPINALSSFLPQGAAKYWAKAFSMQNQGGEPTYSGLPGTESKRSSFSHSIRAATIQLPANQTGPAATNAKIKRKLDQVKNKLKEMQASTPPHITTAANHQAACRIHPSNSDSDSELKPFPFESDRDISKANSADETSKDAGGVAGLGKKLMKEWKELNKDKEEKDKHKKVSGHPISLERIELMRTSIMADMPSIKPSLPPLTPVPHGSSSHGIIIPDRHQPSILPIISDLYEDEKDRETVQISSQQNQAGLGEEQRKATAHRIKIFFDSAISNVKEEFEKKEDSHNIAKKDIESDDLTAHRKKDKKRKLLTQFLDHRAPLPESDTSSDKDNVDADHGEMESGNGMVIAERLGIGSNQYEEGHRVFSQQEADEESFISEKFNRLQKMKNKQSIKPFYPCNEPSSLEQSQLPYQPALHAFKGLKFNKKHSKRHSDAENNNQIQEPHITRPIIHASQSCQVSQELHANKTYPELLDKNILIQEHKKSVESPSTFSENLEGIFKGNKKSVATFDKIPKQLRYKKKNRKKNKDHTSRSLSVSAPSSGTDSSEETLNKLAGKLKKMLNVSSSPGD